MCQTQDRRGELTDVGMGTDCQVVCVFLLYSVCMCAPLLAHVGQCGKNVVSVLLLFTSQALTQETRGCGEEQ